MKRYTVIMSTWLLCMGLTANAQTTTYDRHEFSIYGNGGLSTLNYRMTNGAQYVGFGGGGGLGYTFNIAPLWGIHTGLGVALYNSSASITNGVHLITHDLEDNTGDWMDLHTTFEGHTEAQRAVYLNIPLMFQFRVGNFQLQAGYKLGIPLAASFKVSGLTVSNRALYLNMSVPPTYEVWAPDAKALGFGEFDNESASGALKLKVAVSASLEAGLWWTLSPKYKLYTGVYLDYGLNDIIANRERNVLEWNDLLPSKPFHVNSVLTSHNPETKYRITDHVSPLALGVKIALSLGTKKTPINPVMDDFGERKPDSTEFFAQQKADSIVEAAQQRADEMLAEAQKKANAILAAEKRRDSITNRSHYSRDLKGLADPIQQYNISTIELPENYIKVLDRKVEILRKYPYINVVITGHTCNIGTDQINYLIGMRRATEIRNYLINKGIDPKRLEVDSKGKLQPILPNDTEANRAKNRRVEITIVD